jgi:hypothetical protein
MDFLKMLLATIVPSLVEKLTSKGVPPPVAKSAVDEAAAEVLSAHERLQESRLGSLEQRLGKLEALAAKMIK